VVWNSETLKAGATEKMTVGSHFRGNDAVGVCGGDERKVAVHMKRACMVNQKERDQGHYSTRNFSSFVPLPGPQVWRRSNGEFRAQQRQSPLAEMVDRGGGGMQCPRYRVGRAK
jgi:hypothetical protein